jgi:predicted glycogen debranching enzyme
VHPAGYRFIQGFRLDPWPVTTFRAGEMELEKAVFMPHGQAAAVAQYTLAAAPEPVWLALRPLLACRDYHHLGHSAAGFHSAVTTGPDCFTLEPYDADSQITLIHPGGEFWPDGMWYYSFQYPREQERGLDYAEDLYSPGEIRFLLNPGETAWVVAATRPDLEPEPEAWAEEERERRTALASCPACHDDTARQLTLAADQFLVRRQVGGQELLSLIAGYPWFTDWGRDAMIALPGLLLLPGRHAEAAQVLAAFAGHVQGGLLPNTFGDDGQGAAYNTVDAALWFIHAVRLYAEHTGDFETIRERFYEPVTRVLSAYRSGTDFGIGMDEDGLIRAGSIHTQLTWMDAKIGDTAFTPREGKPVEINGLWYSALRTGQYLAEKLGGEGGTEYKRLADRVRTAFERDFWCEEHGYFYDRIGEAGPDATLRPNQVIALALPYPLGTPEQARRALDAVTRNLLTPYGLRTLAPYEPGYRGQCTGDQWQRDAAYHNGTVWPWLLGPYGSALLRVEGDSTESRGHLRKMLGPLVDYLFDGGTGSLPEIFDGDPPHAPRGTFAQAWSVGEVLRLWLHYRLDEV